MPNEDPSTEMARLPEHDGAVDLGRKLELGEPRQATRAAPATQHAYLDRREPLGLTRRFEVGPHRRVRAAQSAMMVDRVGGLALPHLGAAEQRIRRRIERQRPKLEQPGPARLETLEPLQGTAQSREGGRVARPPVGEEQRSVARTVEEVVQVLVSARSGTVRLMPGDQRRKPLALSPGSLSPAQYGSAQGMSHLVIADIACQPRDRDTQTRLETNHAAHSNLRSVPQPPARQTSIP